MESHELLSKYFSGNATEDEIAYVENWAAESEENRLEFIRYKAAWSAADPGRFDGDKAFAKVAPRLKQKNTPVVELPTKERPNLLRIAAAVTILIASSLIIYFYFSAGLFEDTEGASGTITDSGRQVELYDGSQLYLAEAGSLTYESDFKKDNQRKVKLDGMAFFDIRKNKEKPFIIMTENAEIEVTGTSFLVEEHDGYTEVIVESGSVKMKKSAGLSYIRLQQGEIGIASSTSKGLVKRKNKNKNYLSWMTGNFEFKATPLSEVFSLLEESYGVKIKVTDQSIGKCRYTSDFEKRSIEDILTIIGKSLDLQLTNKGKTYTFSGEGCS